MRPFVLFVCLSFVLDASSKLSPGSSTTSTPTEHHTYDEGYTKTFPEILSYDTLLPGSSKLPKRDPESWEIVLPKVYDAPCFSDRKIGNQHTPTPTPKSTESCRRQLHEQRDIPEPTPPPSPALKDNTMCIFLGAALGICNSLTPGFTTMGPSMQAQCLCYSSAAWSPKIFDNAVGECAAFASTAATLAYAPLVDLKGFCASVGDVKAPKSTSVTTTSSIPTVINSTCDMVTKALVSCAEKDVTFESLDATGKARCLCYDSNTSWRPTQFDNAVKTCAEDTYFATTLPLVQPLAGLCGGVGNVLQSITKTSVNPTGVTESSNLPSSSLGVTTLPSSSMLPVTTFSDSTVSSAISLSGLTSPSSQVTKSASSPTTSQSSATLSTSVTAPSTSDTPSSSTKTITSQTSIPRYIPNTILNTPSSTSPPTGTAMRGKAETWEIILVSFCCAMVLLFLY